MNMILSPDALEFTPLVYAAGSCNEELVDLLLDTIFSSKDTSSESAKIGLYYLSLQAIDGWFYQKLKLNTN